MDDSQNNELLGTGTRVDYREAPVSMSTEMGVQVESPAGSGISSQSKSAEMQDSGLGNVNALQEQDQQVKARGLMGVREKLANLSRLVLGDTESRKARSEAARKLAEDKFRNELLSDRRSAREEMVRRRGELSDKDQIAGIDGELARFDEQTAQAESGNWKSIATDLSHDIAVKITSGELDLIKDRGRINSSIEELGFLDWGVMRDIQDKIHSGELKKHKEPKDHEGFYIQTG